MRPTSIYSSARPLLSWALLGVFGCHAGGESGEPEGATEGGQPICVPGESIGCECSGGAAGAQVCGDDGLSFAECECSGCPVPSTGFTPLPRLTRSQYENTIRDLLGIDASTVAAGLAPDERVGPFLSNGTAPVAELQVEQYMDGAEALAAKATEDLGVLLPCDPGQVGENVCAEAFVRDLVPRAFRRPVEEQVVQGILGAYAAAKAGADFPAGIRVALQSVLQSPYFLYHLELGDPSEPGDGGAVLALTSHEYAARLSYFIWDSMPDDELTAAAGAGDLDDFDGRRQQVSRMLADSKARAGIANFHLQWLAADELVAAQKDAATYPAYDAALAQAMVDETAAYARYVLGEDDGRLETLLTASYTLSEDDALLALYGAQRPAGHSTGQPIPLDATQRGGLLTQASFLAAHAHPNQSSPVLRGVIVRENVLCQILPPPPPNVANVPPEPDPNATTRERFAKHTEDPECAGCHELVDGLGFGFEQYDGIGAFRDEESGRPIDASGTIVGTDVDGEFNGAVELGAILAGSDQVRECVVRQWLRFALGRSETDADQCTTDLLLASFRSSDGDIRQLLLDIALSDSFRYIAQGGGQ